MFVCVGCGWFQTQKKEESAQELTDSGMKAFNKGKYGKAIEHFEKLKDWHPFSKFAILAELKIADSHYYLKEYEEAIVAYEEFENLHPRNEAIPECIYHTGLCYFNQIDAIDRDQSVAKKALETFQRLARQFSDNDEYTRKANEHIKKCSKSLAEHEFYVGKFYYKSKHYKAALSRFKAILVDYSDVGVRQKTLKYIALCESSLKTTNPTK